MQPLGSFVRRPRASTRSARRGEEDGHRHAAYPSIERQFPLVALSCAAALLLVVALAGAQGPAGPGEPGSASGSQAGPSGDDESMQPPGMVAAPSAYSGQDASRTPALSRQDSDDRIRQGTELTNQLGTFRLTGDRITFFTKLGKGRFVVLENLALERVAQMIEDNPQQLNWLVSGVMMEYQGANYLLIQRAVLKSQIADEDPLL